MAPEYPPVENRSFKTSTSSAKSHQSLQKVPCGHSVSNIASHCVLYSGPAKLSCCRQNNSMMQRVVCFGRPRFIPQFAVETLRDEMKLRTSVTALYTVFYLFHLLLPNKLRAALAHRHVKEHSVVPSGHFLCACDTQSRGRKMPFRMLFLFCFVVCFLHVGVCFAWSCLFRAADHVTGVTDECRRRYITAPRRVSASAAAQAAQCEPVLRPRPPAPSFTAGDVRTKLFF